MSIKIKTEFVDVDLDSSKFFGEILLPENWLMENVFSPEELFLCQINLSEVYEAVGKTLLPDQGMLYFFIDYAQKPKAVVRYYDGEADAYTVFNEDWEGDDDVISNLKIDFELSEDDEGLLVSGDLANPDKIVLLKVCPDKLEDFDFMCDSGLDILFVMDTQSLKKKDFSQVELKFEKSSRK